MSGSAGKKNAGSRQCIYCGKIIGRNLMQCPYCREAQTEARTPAASIANAGSGGQLRSGLLLVLMGAAVEYFAGGYGPMAMPDQLRSPVNTYLVPLLFVSGIGMSLYGVFLRLRS
jgi:hypothetical protein